jgi:hypothetical protein
LPWVARFRDNERENHRIGQPPPKAERALKSGLTMEKDIGHESFNCISNRILAIGLSRG